MFILVISTSLAVMFHLTRCDELPRNVVVMSGSDKVLSCAGALPFRWYVYPPSNPTDDRVLFTGVRMADEADPQFRVYMKPNNFPYDRLDLLVTDIKPKSFGTYKCLKSKTSHCAEMIVLGSEPRCSIHNALGNSAQLRCEVNITVNGMPEMECVHNFNRPSIHSICNERTNEDIAVCSVIVPYSSKRDYTCVIGIKHRPLLTYRTCEHATNSPDYQFIWPTSSTADSYDSNECKILNLFLLIVAMSVALIFAVSIGVLCVKRNRQSRPVSIMPIWSPLGPMHLKSTYLLGEHSISKSKLLQESSPNIPATPPPSYCSSY